MYSEDELQESQVSPSIKQASNTPTKLKEPAKGVGVKEFYESVAEAKQIDKVIPCPLYIEGLLVQVMKGDQSARSSAP